jgi:hypothetical protein
MKMRLLVIATPVGLVVVVAVVAACWPQIHALLSWRDAPAWVQAVGSILVLFTGFGVAWWQAAQARREAKERAEVAGRAVKVRALIDGGNVIGRLIKCHNVLIQTTIQGAPELRLMLSAVDADLQLQERFNPAFPDMKAMQAYMNLRTVLFAVRGELSAALELAKTDRASVSASVDALKRAFGEMTKQARISLHVLEERLGMKFFDVAGEGAER